MAMAGNGSGPGDIAERLRELRIKAGLDPEGIADQIGISTGWYVDLETEAGEAEDSLDLTQWRKLAVLLHVGMGFLLTGAILPDETPAFSFQEVARRVRAYLEHAALEELETKTGWELGAFLKRPAQEGWEQRAPFFRDLCGELGLDWRGVLKYCESIREE
jgi:transcriptional regulator with XRE-family HTH domain